CWRNLTATTRQVSVGYFFPVSKSLTATPGCFRMGLSFLRRPFPRRAEARLGHSFSAGRRPVQEQKIKSTPWKSKPSWYILATKDHTVNPDLQRWVSKRMGATVVEVESSHIPMLSKPDVVIDVIRQAATAVQKTMAA